MSPVETLAPDRDTHSLQCLEVWGGNQHMDADVAVTGLDVSVRSRTWRNQPHGGDIYLVLMCGCAKISRFMLADVSGHGEHVGELARRLRQLMQKHINKPDQTRLAAALNREFARFSGDARFATAMLATYQPETDELTLCNAGHPAPLWYHTEQASWQRLDPTRKKELASPVNFPFGVVPGTSYEQYSIRLAPNDVVVLLSDGLTERGPSNDCASLARDAYDQLEGMRAPPGEPLALEVVDEVVRDVLKRDHDDRTMMVLAHNGGDPPVQLLREKLGILGRMVGLPT